MEGAYYFKHNFTVFFCLSFRPYTFIDKEFISFKIEQLWWWKVRFRLVYFTCRSVSVCIPLKTIEIAWFLIFLACEAHLIIISNTCWYQLQNYIPHVTWWIYISAAVFGLLFMAISLCYLLAANHLIYLVNFTVYNFCRELEITNPYQTPTTNCIHSWPLLTIHFLNWNENWQCYLESSMPSTNLAV